MTDDAISTPTSEGLWLRRYMRPSLLRSVGGFALYATEQHDTRAGARTPRVVAVGSPDEDPTSIRRALDEVARVHQLLDSAHIPPVAERGREGEIEFLALGRSAALTLETLRSGLGTTEFEPAPYHISMHNILVSADGHIWVLGFGHHLIGTQDSFRPAHAAPDPA